MAEKLTIKKSEAEPAIKLLLEQHVAVSLSAADLGNACRICDELWPCDVVRVATYCQQQIKVLKDFLDAFYEL